jgi:hypothetical protein
MLSELHSLNLKLCSKQYNKKFVLHLIVGPQLCSGWRHNYSTKTREAGRANEQSMYYLMSMWLTDWLNEECLERGCALRLQGCGHALSLPPSFSFSPSVSLSLCKPVWRVFAGVLYACKGAHSLFTGQRERKRKRERERERCGRFVEQKLMLSSNFRCDQIYRNERCDFGHTLLCYLSLT